MQAGEIVAIHRRLRDAFLPRPRSGFFNRHSALFLMIMQMLLNGYRCHLHLVYRLDGRSHNSDSTGGSSAPRRTDVALRIVTENTALTMRQHCEQTSPRLPSAHAHTFSPLTPAPLSQTPALYRAGTHTDARSSESCFQRNMRLLSLSKHCCRGGIGRKREAAILELLLHRQWLVQCNIQLYSGFSQQLGDFK